MNKYLKAWYDLMDMIPDDFEGSLSDEELNRWDEICDTLYDLISEVDFID